jgi:hypothetical protein
MWSEDRLCVKANDKPTLRVACLQWVRTLVLVLCLGWASFATIPFIGKTVSSE